jgi:hypothetical protein
MDKTKYLKWYKLAREVVNDDFLVPERSDDLIMSEFVSEGDWLLFTPAGISTKNEAINSPLPNIFFRLKENICRIGLTYNNVKSTDVLKNILSGHCAEDKKHLIDGLLGLDAVWKIKVNRKIKDKNHAQTPKYHIYEGFPKSSNDINDGIVDEIIKASNTIREEGREKRKKMEMSGKYYLETPSINIMECEFELSERTFKKRIGEAFEILKICLKVKTDSQIKKLDKKHKTELEKLRSEIEGFEARASRAKRAGLIDNNKLEELRTENEERKKRLAELEKSRS